MLLVVVLFIALAVVIIGSRLQAPGRVNAARLGWMSEKWLAAYRASRSS